jgi:hypothetical protein
MPVNSFKISYVPLLSSINKTDCHDIAEILLKVTLNTINHEKMVIINNLIQYITFVEDDSRKNAS